MPETQPTATRWMVLSQTPQKVIDNAGKAVDGYLVTAQVTESGTVFQVTVPESGYTPDKVRALLEAKYEQVTGVDGLSG